MAPQPAADDQLPSTASASFRDVNGISLHVVTAGDPNAPLVVLLHGFPEFWYAWYDYIEPLVEAGYRVLVPDQRGYNRSEKLDGVRPYRITELSADIVSLIETESQRAHVIGHDWGGVVTWDLALRHPDSIDRAGIINAPHPSAYRRVVRSNPTQLYKSWYIIFFQLPRIPEWFVKRADFQQWTRAIREGARPGTFTKAKLQRYRNAWSRDGAPTAMMNWYRALARHHKAPPRERVTASTLLVWGENDQALVPELAPKSIDHCEEGTLERFPEATHWINHERPKRVSELLIDHLEAH